MNETAAVPDWVWGGTDYRSVHAAVLCAKINNGMLLAGTLPPADYDHLVNALQQVACSLADSLREQGYPLAEAHVLGDQLVMYLYDPAEVERNFLLDGPQPVEGRQRDELVQQCRNSNEALTFHALKAAILLKNVWIVHEVNLQRVLSHLEPWELQIILHSGWATYGERADAKRRIEGYTVSLARHLLSGTPAGVCSRIFASQHFHDTLRSSVVKHTQLRQRVFFHSCDAHGDSPPILTRPVRLYELKFCHRAGIQVTEEVVGQYDAIFNLDQANIWAYYQLVEYYAHVKRDWNKVFSLAKAAQLAHPSDERVLLDLAKYYMHQNKLDQSRKFAEEALRINESFDMAYEHLAVLASAVDDPEQVGHFRNAVRLSPGSPVNNFNLGLALLEYGQEQEGFHYIQEAVRIYPDYRNWDAFTSALSRIRKSGNLPELLEAYLEPEEHQPSAAA